jgi:hypothetical protein
MKYILPHVEVVHDEVSRSSRVVVYTGSLLDNFDLDIPAVAGIIFEDGDGHKWFYSDSPQVHKEWIENVLSTAAINVLKAAGSVFLDRSMTLLKACVVGWKNEPKG